MTRSINPDKGSRDPLRVPVLTMLMSPTHISLGEESQGGVPSQPMPQVTNGYKKVFDPVRLH
jgi:hypothetical protein